MDVETPAKELRVLWERRTFHCGVCLEQIDPVRPPAAGAQWSASPCGCGYRYLAEFYVDRPQPPPHP